MAYTNGLGIDQPLTITRIAYVDYPIGGDSLMRWAPFTIVPHWNARGEADLGTTGDGSVAHCLGTGAAKRCASINWPFGWTAYRQQSSIRVTWHGSLVEQKQDASGLLYRRERYMDPATGRFTQEDPIGLAGGYNLYGFANSDPVNYSDPFGLCPIEKPLCHWIKVTLIAAGTDLGGIAGGGAGLLAGPAALVASPAGAFAGMAAGAAIGAAAGELIDNVFFSKSDHARQRAAEGRPVREGAGDVQRARESDVFVQENGRIIVRGARGREQIFESNGEHVTSVVRPNAAHLQRLRGGTIRPATSEEFQAFKALFQ